MHYVIGDLVTAQDEIYDTMLSGRPRCVARYGDQGRVEYVDSAGVPTVRWTRTGFTIDCDDKDIEVSHAR